MNKHIRFKYSSAFIWSNQTSYLIHWLWLNIFCIKCDTLRETYLIELDGTLHVIKILGVSVLSLIVFECRLLTPSDSRNYSKGELTLTHVSLRASHRGGNIKIFSRIIGSGCILRLTIRSSHTHKASQLMSLIFLNEDQSKTNMKFKRLCKKKNMWLYSKFLFWLFIFKGALGAKFNNFAFSDRQKII